MSIQKMKALVEELAASDEVRVEFSAIHAELNEIVAALASKEHIGDLRKQIELAWLSRARENELLHEAGKRPSKAYLKAEAEFIAGAMTALNAVLPGTGGLIGPLVPAGWVFASFTGNGIVKVPA